MNENWYTLAIAVLYEKPCTIEQAFELYNKGNVVKKSPKSRSKEDIEDILKLRKSLSLQEIADIYCLSKSTVCRIIRKFKQKKSCYNSSITKNLI